MASRVDIVLFGASGYTGKYCIGDIHKLAKANGRSLTWGIAGRSEAKLKETLLQYQNTIGEDLNSVPVIVADVNNYESLKKMTARAKIIINCCGPYRFFGEPVVKACIETGTHHVDVSGEPQYIESMQLNYHKAAEEKGVYIVSACGFDSIPADLGVLFLQKNFQGTLNSVETYLQLSEEPPPTPGAAINYGTWHSLVYGLAHANELGQLRRKLYPTRLPSFLPKLKPRPQLHKSELINARVLPFMGSDRSVILRSQRYFYEQKKWRPAQVQTYMGIESFFTVMLLVVLGGLLTFLVKYEFGRKLLLQYPKFFSAGVFSHEGPSEEKVKKTKVSMTFYGEGWSEKLSEVDDEYQIPPNKTVIARVSAYNPGYGVTCYAVTLAAIMILTEANKLPGKGGVYPPAAAFADTTLIEQLQNSGLKFEILSNL